MESRRGGVNHLNVDGLLSAVVAACTVECQRIVAGSVYGRGRNGLGIVRTLLQRIAIDVRHRIVQSNLVARIMISLVNAAHCGVGQVVVHRCGLRDNLAA